MRKVAYDFSDVNVLVDEVAPSSNTHVVLHAPGRRERQLKRLIVGSGLALSAILCGALLLDRIEPAPQQVAVRAPEPVWVEIAKPFQLFSLPAPELAREKSSYQARRHASGGGRQDILTFGGFGEPGPYVRLVIHRVGGEYVPETSFFVDVARRAAEAGLAVTRSLAPAGLPTRFGTFETADVSLASGSSSEPTCLGFRMSVTKPDMRISGLACGSHAKPMERVQLTCLLDRLDLVSAGDDKAMRAFFAGAELARNTACLVPRQQSLNPKTSWLDPQGSLPSLKGVKPRSDVN